jgi:transposase
MVYLHGGGNMASIIKQKVGRNTYLYESVSFRKNGKPKNRRVIIGKIDSSTGDPVYKSEYIERMNMAGTPVVALKKKIEFSYEEIKGSVIKEYGAFYFYQKIAEKTGLMETVRKVFPDEWRELFVSACYLTSSGDPMMYCRDWMEKTDCFPVELDSQRISALLQSMTHERQEAFFREWGKYRSEREYLALDITSISSYSRKIETVEWGYNRDGEKLPQVNLCMLLGEQSRLPVYQHLYNGSIKDVSTLESSLRKAFCIGRKRLTLVMDKGFYSRNNVKTLLETQFSQRFLMAVPFTLKKAKELINGLRQTMDRAEYAIALSRTESLQGVCREIEWYNDKEVYAHVYFNMVKAVEEKNSLYSYAASLAEKAKKDPEDKNMVDAFKKYLIIGRDNTKITINQKVLDEEVAHAGWMVLISNHIKDTKKALSIYRAKDAVEKGFYRLKNNLDMNRLRVHSDGAMEGKVFLGFIALILMSHIHHVMTCNKMYKSYTLKELIKQMEKLRVQYISGNRILFPLTKFQKNIFDAFQVEYPV